MGITKNQKMKKENRCVWRNTVDKCLREALGRKMEIQTGGSHL